MRCTFLFFYQMKCVTAGMFPCLGTQYWHFLFLPYTVGRPERFDSGLTCPFTLLYTGTNGLDFILLFFFLKKGHLKPLSLPHKANFYFLNVRLLILPF